MFFSFLSLFLWFGLVLQTVLAPTIPYGVTESLMVLILVRV